MEWFQNTFGAALGITIGSSAAIAVIVGGSIFGCIALCIVCAVLGQVGEGLQ